jgi:hypothetical protein
MTAPLPEELVSETALVAVVREGDKEGGRHKDSLRCTRDLADSRAVPLSGLPAAGSRMDMQGAYGDLPMAKAFGSSPGCDTRIHGDFLRNTERSLYIIGYRNIS